MKSLRTMKPKQAMRLEPEDFIKWVTHHRGGHAHEIKLWCSRYLGLRNNPQMDKDKWVDVTEEDCF